MQRLSCMTFALALAVLVTPVAAEGMFNRDPMDETRQTPADRARIERLEQRQPIVQEPVNKAPKAYGAHPRKKPKSGWKPGCFNNPKMATAHGCN